MSEAKTMNPEMSRRDEMETLLPFYLNGTLEGAELAAVEDWLASDPAAMEALGEAEAEFSGTTATNEAIRPPADALSRFARALDAEAGPGRAPERSGTVVQLWNRFRAVPSSVAWAVAAALLAFVVVQGTMQPGGKTNDFEIAGAEDELAKLPFALVKFKPDAKMADVVAFLGTNGMKIVTGPNGDGVFRISIPAETGADYAKLFGLVAAQPFTDTAVEGRKPADAS